MMEESVSTFETHLTAVMDSLIRASVCEITKLFQETVNDYLVELSLSKRENEALKLRLRLTENKLRTERKYGLGWAVQRRNAGLAAPAAEVDGAESRQKRKVEMTRGKPKKRLTAAFGKDWPGAVWEEEGGGSGGGGGGGSGGTMGMVQGGRGGEKAREMYLMQFPGDEEDEGGMVEDEEGEGSLSVEGEEISNIKEEFDPTESYQPASLQLIREALKMQTPSKNLQAASRSQSEETSGGLARGQLLACGSEGHYGCPSCRRERGGEDWDVDSAEPPDAGMSGDDLRGLESALRSDGGPEQTAILACQPVPTDPEVVCGSKMNLAPKYIGLDGMEQDGESARDPPDLQREEQLGQGKSQDTKPGAELKSAWAKRLRDSKSAAALSGDESVELGKSELFPNPSAPGSVGESGGEEEGVRDLLHFCPQCGGAFTTEAEVEDHPCPLGGSQLGGGDEGLSPVPTVATRSATPGR
ncbi:hypothetical protein D4764_09G0006490 [Takifugu flavidus]|uniref:Uncharacterized protein n=1 Tax=Takifugu flavidus TaxID=433684 RepID=A0A5C6MQA1_9TELE|nr:hypothetical protein D4764_09G0006490 [Takifugu flavidus]